MPPRLQPVRTRKRKIEEVEEVEESDQEENNDTTDKSDDSGSSSDDSDFETIAKARPRRATAGTKMQELIEKQKEKDAKEMVQSEEAYKDFFEVENDADFEADDEVIKSESEVDSDFDQEEVDDEPEDAGEAELRNQKRSKSSSTNEKAKKKRERMMKELASNLLVEDNVVDAKTHARYMQEAKLVAKKNQEDLRRIEMELEKQRNETLESLRPRVKVQRTDVVKIEQFFDENGQRINRITIPDEMIRKWEPSKLWLSRQHLLPPKPPGFDDLPYEKI